ncbi:MAG: fimbrillin family protein [Muribaculaceae bacterium]|nr:fimbrillin family protein [Muribaculaceae bacterium]
MISFAPCLFVSCADAEPDDSLGGKEMRFSVRNEDGASRANNVSFNSFSIFADMKRDDAHNNMLMMENALVTFNQTSDRWEYGVTQYWMPNFEYSFVALTPGSVFYEPNANKVYLGSQLSFRYSLPDDYTRITDILAATHRRRYTDGETVPVMLNFHHLLSRINVAPKFDDNELNNSDILKFHRLEITNVARKATFTLAPAPLQTGDRTDDCLFDISGYEGKVNYTAVFNTPVQLINHGNSKLIFDQGMLMLPQEFAEESGCCIILSYTINNDVEQSLLTIPLDNIRWESGMSYTFNFIFDKMGLKMQTLTITPWTDIEKDFNFNIE